MVVIHFRRFDPKYTRSLFGCTWFHSGPEKIETIGDIIRDPGQKLLATK